MFDLIATAYAAAAPEAAADSGTRSLLMIVLMIAVFYFILIRPENKRKKEAESMRSALKKGDHITTIGGIYGRVVAINDRTVVIETSEDRVRMEFLKSAIGQVGTLEEQAAAQQKSGGLFGKKKTEDAKAEKIENVEKIEPTASEVSSEEK